MQFLLSSSATTEFCLKICVTRYSRQIVSDFLKVVCANGQAKTVFEVTTLRNRFSCGACHLQSTLSCQEELTQSWSFEVIWGLMLYSVFGEIIPRIKTVNAFIVCTASFTSRYKFARQSRLSVIPYWEVNFDWFSKLNPSSATELYASGLYACDDTYCKRVCILNFFSS